MVAILDENPRAIAALAGSSRQNLAVQPIPQNVRVATARILDLELSTNRKTVQILHFVVPFL